MAFPVQIIIISGEKKTHTHKHYPFLSPPPNPSFLLSSLLFPSLGHRGDHSTERYDRVRLSEINTTEEETAEAKLKQSEV